MCPNVCGHGNKGFLDHVVAPVAIRPDRLTKSFLSRFLLENTRHIVRTMWMMTFKDDYLGIAVRVRGGFEYVVFDGDVARMRTESFSDCGLGLSHPTSDWEGKTCTNILLNGVPLAHCQLVREGVNFRFYLPALIRIAKDAVVESGNCPAG